MTRGGRRAGAGRPSKYVKDLGNAAPALMARISRVASLARQLESKCERLVSSFPDAEPGKLAAGVVALGRIQDDIAAERAAILATLRGEPSTAPQRADAGAESGKADLFSLNSG